MYLSYADLDMLNTAVYELHSFVDSESLFAALPAIALRAIPADYFRLLECTVDAGARRMTGFRFWESHPRIDAWLQEQFYRWLPQHPFLLAAQPNGYVGAIKLSDFLTQRQFRETALFREMYGPIGVGALLGAGLPAGPARLTLSATRPCGARDFSERDRSMLALIQPQFDRALRNLAARSRVRSRADAATPDTEPLTPRETEVALWMSRGKTNPEIASILEIRPRTAEKHVESILEKLGAENRTAASLLLAGAADGKRR